MKVYRIKKTGSSNTWKSYDSVQLNDEIEMEVFFNFIEKSCKKERIKVQIDSSVIEGLGYIDLIKEEESFVVLEDENQVLLNLAELKTINVIEYFNDLLPRIEYCEYIQSVQKTSVLTNFVERMVIRSFDGSKYHYNRIPDFKYVAILGEPGCGKTTTLRRLACEIISHFEFEKELKILPIYFQLRHFNSKGNISETIIEYVNSFFSGNVYDEISELSEKGKVLYLFDGLDELSALKRIEFIRWLNSFRFKMPNARIIITSRLVLPNDQLSEFERFYLVPFTLNQIKELSYRKLYRKKWKNFISCLQIDDELLEIVRNPLLLNISFILFVANKLIPTNKSSYLKNFINTLICDWDIHRDIYRYNDKVSSETVKYYLTKLAFNSKVCNLSSFNNYDASNWLNLDSEETDYIFSKIKEISGLLVESEKKWEFSHLAFRDFLCASYMIEKSDGIGKFEKEFGKSKAWNGIWHNAYGLSNDPEFYYKQYLNKSNIDIYEAIRLCKILQESLKLDKSTLEPILMLLNNFIQELIIGTELQSRYINEKSKIVVTFSIHKESAIKIDQLETFITAFIETRWSNYNEVIGKMIQIRSDAFGTAELLYTQRGKLINAQKDDMTIEFSLDEEFPELT